MENETKKPSDFTSQQAIDSVLNKDNWRVVLSNDDAKTVGKDLIAAANEQRKKRFGNLVMNHIQDMMTQRVGCLALIEKVQKEMELYELRLKAVEDGEFTVGYDGSVIYNNDILNMSFAEYRERK